VLIRDDAQPGDPRLQQALAFEVGIVDVDVQTGAMRMRPSQRKPGGPMRTCSIDVNGLLACRRSSMRNRPECSSAAAMIGRWPGRSTVRK